jgi:lysophospholipase L1-like esterase
MPSSALALLAALLAAAAALPARAEDGSGVPSSFVGAADPAFAYRGRIDARDPQAPVLVWQSSRVDVGFEGRDLSIAFGGARDQAFLNARVDGEERVIRVPKDRATVRWTGPLGPGHHELSLVKRTEAGSGTAVFLGIGLEAGARASSPATKPPRLRLLFLGDSITAGACNEDGPEDQWTDRSTHNATLSYAALTADALRADFENISVSGMGISEGYVGVTAGEVWDRLYPEKDAPRADLGKWRPDVVFFNFGENDASFTRVHERPFPATYVGRYGDLIAAVRAAFPGAELVLLRGGMGGGATDPRLIRPWTEVVRKAEAGDPGVSHFVFTHWSSLHPRVADDRAMAGELVAWLRAQAFMARN